jgi:glycosyltransferase involved in cell wall biosynthesis
MSKRIAFVINKLGIGGAERVVQTLTIHYRSLGYRVSIYTLHDGELAYEFPDDVPIIPLISGRLAIGLGKILFLPLFSLELAWRLHKLRPDGTISFLVRANLVHAMTKWFGNRKKINISERSIMDEMYSDASWSSKIMRFLVRYFYPQADRIVAISHGVKNSLLNYRVMPEKVEVIYNPQDLSDIKKKASMPCTWMVRRDVPTLVTSSRLVELKDHRTLFRALRRISDSMKVHLLVLGEGPELKGLKSYAEELSIAEQITWGGWQLNPYTGMKLCDFFVLTSTFEGFGNVLVEAMACGLPVISTDCPTGPREILDNGRYGLLVPVGNDSALAGAILKLLGEPDTRRELIEKGYLRSDEFSVDKVAKHYLDVLTSS